MYTHTISVLLLDGNDDDVVDDDDDDDNDDDDNDDDDDDRETVDDAFATTATSLLFLLKSLGDNKPSDTIASLKLFWSIWRHRAITAGLSKSPAALNLTNIQVYIWKNDKCEKP